MPLTRSIRRKLLLLLAILVVMLAGLMLASLTGLAGYKRVVHDLDVTLRQAPRSSDLTASFTQLIEPLSAELPPENVSEAQRQRVLRSQAEHFRTALDRVEADVDRYFDALAALPCDRKTRERTDTVRTQLRDKLSGLRRTSELLAQSENRAEGVAWIGRELTKLATLAAQAPRPSVRLIDRLQAAERDYRLHVRVVRATAIATGFSLALLVFLLVKWIIKPVRRLARGARLVAAGRYETRIHLSGGDEMAELAATFNRMTERFQTVMAEQHQEIDIRSRQLVQSARLADVGFLAAGIAHEVNNPLAAIGMAAESLDWRLGEVLEQAQAGGASEDDLDGIRQYLLMIQTEAGRVRDLTQRMLDFARRSPESGDDDRNLYDIGAIVGEVLDMVGHLKRYGGREIAFAGGEQPVRASVNASQIKQVILNLVTNALEATDDGGRLTIDLRTRPDAIELSVTDDGCGMAPEVADHIFDPFFTTKAGGSSGTAGTGGEPMADGNAGHTGTGLGLSISHRIVEDHQGSLRAVSAGEGQGSTFTLRLPRPVAAMAARAA